MSTKVESKCDGCGEEVGYTGNSIDYYIVLDNAVCQPWFTKDPDSRGGAVTDMMIYPPVRGGAKHFHGLGCMAKWFKEKHPALFAASHTQEKK